MTTTLKYVGKKSGCTGKTLWEILGNLKDFGVGRIIVRNSYTRYKEPCYMRVLEVKAQPNEVPPPIKVYRPPNDLRDRDRARQVHIKCEWIFRGIKYEEPKQIDSESQLPDYSLVPKHLEHKYTYSKLASEKRDENILPAHIDTPPFLKYLLKKEGIENVKIKTVLRNNTEALYRVAKDGEQPTRSFNGIKDSKSPNLYKGIQEI